MKLSEQAMGQPCGGGWMAGWLAGLSPSGARDKATRREKTDEFTRSLFDRLRVLLAQSEPTVDPETVCTTTVCFARYVWF